MHEWEDGSAGEMFAMEAWGLTLNPSIHVNSSRHGRLPVIPAWKKQRWDPWSKRVARRAESMSSGFN